ncbi:hypothetical protein [Desulfolutivibrio sulfoxidireducens]|uniref:hypothetical protein n=1 Tax=Desulfolutivibrio sulfoxidireducens TaxID=2773299 RepID=UPI00159E4BA2|nr:hypothetical protein [Desulfolutivibrio sulfoxidireducens]QLA15015.1 hypothetical protein GD605_02070 [Desulfolutivibrio sulfoxidireducens]QLA18582.1 hypothetical protein GD604_01980 [Desulfolutivibrio sulfoxidireducens]
MKTASQRLAFAVFLFGVGGLLCNWPLLAVAVEAGLWPAAGYLAIAWGVLLAGLFLLSRAFLPGSEHEPHRRENGEPG